ncbi:dihydrolipoyl dehydrogenase family protein [Dongia rigui]|uniref:FAD-dependent oxidoreductase n=1 Tax=Dongia rigui TaxID=940149 RepID=A0ABU5DVW9_9PROT|nr:FAD-dependent oxidoreductase [Dongia rigui]MDY0870736.1 FAD-dependent oxidoreductase [Dongia rigui]
MTEMPTLTPDICVIGAGSGGLTVAAGAAQLGASVVLVEEGEMGGDCLNSGCVPSKALLAAAHQAATVSQAKKFGVSFRAPTINRANVAKHIAGVIAGIAPHDSVERFEGLGVTVIRGRGVFAAPDAVIANGQRIQAKRFVIATGSKPVLPPIAGLDGIRPFTNETIFGVTEPIEHLLVIGGGPIGVEMAQAQRRLGAKVTLVEMARLLPKDDPELVGFVRTALAADGVDLKEGTNIIRLERNDDGIAAHLANNEGTTEEIAVSHVLVAVGRRPNTDGIGLERAAVTLKGSTIQVDQRLRTSNPRIYAIGDCAGGPAFTHVAGYHGGIVLRNILFRLRAKVNPDLIPWVTFTEPELAYVGLLETAARARFKDVRTETLDFDTNDRARTERRDAGRIKIVLRAGGQILGVGIVGPQAGELLAPWCLAIARGLKLSAMAGLLLPYPTLSEISKRVAGNYYAPRLFSVGVRALVRGLMKLP